ncbi:NAD-dependent epimerase/dehydratase family protein [Blastococcus sp. CT_GayMR16]|uniref:NAD-dependent epimerase/dehydratase family protein n=1 Tax=Blastococcus sp. CT_GayMR16 TaxID=2559607 RepID=UPI001073F4E6|nr:NAD-dependent epimerase/dehydratase family protein [Blastococcus sp. CT_GayMR16]TFV89538.1 NAD-dependent epimerase/dehydratase family protein [Blastococcus sp. CT_GayMR16]
MRVLVTGGAGFIGSHVVSACRDAGHEVRVLDALLPTVHRAGVVPTLPDGVDLLVGDVREAGVVDRALDGVDAVCHQAAKVGLGVDVQDMPEYASINEFGTAVLLAGMARAEVGRLVLASSMVVYGEGRYECPVDGVVPAAPRRRADLDEGRFEPPCPLCGRQLAWGTVTEETGLDPRNTYAATKLGQEHLASAWASSTGGGAIALRYHNVYGPSMPRDTPYAGVAAIFRSALEAGRAPRVFEDGGQQRDFVHVTDVADANLRSLLADPPDSALRAYNVASGQPHTVGDMARALADAFGGPDPQVTGEYRIGDVRHVVASPLLAEKELGFRARVEFEDGMRAFATDPLRAAP